MFNGGLSCNLISGQNCTTSDGSDLIPALQCYTSDNNTCYKDFGLLCNKIGTSNFCDLDKSIT